MKARYVQPIATNVFDGYRGNCAKPASYSRIDHDFAACRIVP